MNKATHSASAFTVLELMVVMALMSIVLLMAVPSFSSMNGQLKASQDIRTLILKIDELRSEAIRRRTNIRISFSTSGYSWDIDNDGTTDGSTSLGRNSQWFGGTPASFVFNGLGLVRGLNSSVETITIRNAGRNSDLKINNNGHISS